MKVTLSTKIEIPRTINKERNQIVTDGSALSTNSIHSHDKHNCQEQGYNIRLVNDFNDFLSVAELNK